MLDSIVGEWKRPGAWPGKTEGTNMSTIKKPDPHEFEFIKNGIVHKPTNAKFTHYPGRTDIEWINYGHAGDVLPNGDDYDRDEIRQMAQKLLNEKQRARHVRDDRR